MIMKIFILRLFIAMTAITLSSCSKKLTGQVFVVTQGRENIEIGLASIHVVPKARFREFATKVVGQVQAEIHMETQEAADFDAVSKFRREMLAMENGGLDIPGLVELIEPVESRFGKLYPDEQQDPIDLFALIRDALLPKFPAVAKTDANGRFQVDVDGDSWLVCHTERQVTGSEESYLWIVQIKAREIDLGSSFLISNDSNVNSFEALYAVLAAASDQETNLNKFTAAGVSSDLANLIAKAKMNAEDAKGRAEKRFYRENRGAAKAKEKPKSIVESGQLGSIFQVELPGEVMMDMVWCPPGNFVMGSPQNEDGRSRNEEQVRVTISRGFWIGKTEVTQAQWEAVMGDNPSASEGKDLPVENVSHEWAMGFVGRVNSSGRLPIGWKFTLPTEAQWEYACRSGTPGPYAGSMDEMGWYTGEGNSDRGTHPVGQKQPNSAGLYDMHGNVSEWCLDRWDGDSKLPGGVDPFGTSGSHRIYRGGSWKFGAERCRSARREKGNPVSGLPYLGFRVVLISTP